MEHINRVVKDAMRTLSSNINESVAVDRIGKVLVNFVENFDKCSDVPMAAILLALHRKI